LRTQQRDATMSSALDIGPFWRAVEGTEMKRANQMHMYRLGNLTRLREINDENDRSRADAMGILIIGELTIKSFLEDQINIEFLPRAVERANELRKIIKRMYDKPVDISGSWLNTALSAFETSLEDDLTRLPTYFIERTGAYSTDQLIGTAENVFPKDLRDNVIPQQAILDFRSAGSCLAYDLPTACGFHVYRATDAMLRHYCVHFGATPQGKGRDWGRYIAALRTVLTGTNAKKPNLRTVELLDSIRAVDRNPLVHPEQNLDNDGALIAFDLCKNAVSLMANDIKASP
jgi:hypothetical protein